jgi:hypothetical protein
MAMGWDFSLNSGEVGTIEFIVTDAAPTEGFYLAQFDRNSTETGIYLQSRLNITPVGVPEPNIMSLFGMGVISLCFLPRSKRR